MQGIIGLQQQLFNFINSLLAGTGKDTEMVSLSGLNGSVGMVEVVDMYHDFRAVWRIVNSEFWVYVMKSTCKRRYCCSEDLRLLFPRKMQMGNKKPRPLRLWRYPI